MKPFYSFLMKYRQPKEIDSITKFANHAFFDHSFPKQSIHYDEIKSLFRIEWRLLGKYGCF